MKMEYYVSINNEKRGPYSVEELRTRGITAETLVMAADGEERWQAAWQVEEIRKILETEERENMETKEQENVETKEREEVIPTGKPMSQEPLREQAYATPQPPVKKKKSYWGCLVFLLVLAICIAAMVLTCPDSKRHKEVITNVMTESISDMAAKGAADNDLLAQGIRIVGNMLIGKVADTAVDNMLTVDNYFICSLGKVHYDGKDHYVSAGVLGHIFTINKEDLTKAAEKYYLDFQHEAEAAVKNQLQQHVVDPIKDQIKQNVIDPIDDMLGGIFGEIMGNEPSSPSHDSEDSDNSDYSDSSDDPDLSESNL